MRILIDLVHPADVNFYKEAISNLKEAHDLIVIVRKRGILEDLARAELDVPIKVVGKHSKSRLGKVLGGIYRILYLMIAGLRGSFDIMTSFGGFYGAVAAKGVGKKSIIFYDDPEYRLCFKLCRIFATRFVIPSILGETGKNITTFNGYKELAYLKNYKISKCLVTRMELSPKNYVFLRITAPISLNYYSLKQNEVYKLVIKFFINKNFVVLLSQEQGASFTPPPSPLVREVKAPIHNFYSLLYYARCVVSSGDTVAREAALLGVCSIYLGKRNLKIHNELIEHGLLKCPSKENLFDILEASLKCKPSRPCFNNWDDTTEIIVRYLDNSIN